MRVPTSLALLSVLALSACGFTPMYAEPGVGSPLRRIAVTAQDDRLGYRLREQLEDALASDRSAAPLYRLTTRVEQDRRPLGRRHRRHRHPL
ncbi:MAG: LPS-assembly lipoprotein [Brevundimonas sp.]|jgi:LPS-assembly lipoprotein